MAGTDCRTPKWISKPMATQGVKEGKDSILAQIPALCSLWLFYPFMFIKDSVIISRVPPATFAFPRDLRRT